MTGVGGSAVRSSQAHSSFLIWSCQIFHRSHRATQKRFMRWYQTCLLNCQQMAHVCRTLNSILTKHSIRICLLSKVFIQVPPYTETPDSNKSLPDFINLNNFIYKWIQVWVISLIFHTRKKMCIFFFLIVLHLLHIMKDWKFMIT